MAILDSRLFFLIFNLLKAKIMTKVVIDKKNYVILPEEDFLLLQKKASSKAKPEKVFSVAEARAHSKKLIRQWATGMSKQNC